MIYQKQDILIGPIIEQLAHIVETQISPPPTKVWRTDPDASPIHNTTTISLSQYKVADDTFGKLEIHFLFSVIHWFRRGKFGDGVTQAYSYLMPYVQAFSDWNNQNYGMWRIAQVQQGGVKDLFRSGEQHVGLVTVVEVITEFNINTSPN